MINPTTDMIIGAAAVYAVVLHMFTVYLYAALKFSRRSVSASEADVAAEGGGG